MAHGQYQDNQWRFASFGLIVTGKGEEEFLPSLFQSLAATGRCHFRVIRRVPQLKPITSARRKQEMVGKGGVITSRDEEIALEARRYLAGHSTFVILVDDLEHDRRTQAEQVFKRYREPLDRMLGAMRDRASVHFLVNMLEAYYFADAATVNSVLGTSLEDCDGDVEDIRNPKSELRNLYVGFDQVEHGRQILAKLDVAHVLSRPETCASLRTLFGWCWRALGWTPTDQYQLVHGSYSDVTKGQNPPAGP